MGGIGALMIAAMVAIAGGCGGKSTSSKNLKLVDTPKAMEAVHGSGGVLGIGGKRSGAWVDPRPEAEYAAGHIPGAINLPFALVASDHKRVLEGYGTIVVYGEDYNDAIAEGMSKRLMELGHGDVLTLRGGLRAWKAAGYEVETGAGTP